MASNVRRPNRMVSNWLNNAAKSKSGSLRTVPPHEVAVGAIDWSEANNRFISTPGSIPEDGSTAGQGQLRDRLRAGRLPRGRAPAHRPDCRPRSAPDNGSVPIPAAAEYAADPGYACRLPRFPKLPAHGGGQDGKLLRGPVQDLARNGISGHGGFVHQGSQTAKRGRGH
jgi:hypothetical protein